MVDWLKVPTNCLMVMVRAGKAGILDLSHWGAFEVEITVCGGPNTCSVFTREG